jgi:hypothetical protein
MSCSGKFQSIGLLKHQSALTLSQPGWNMGSAHQVHELNISLKFHDIHSRGSEDMNWTRNLVDN